mmetsp:Transcript_66831/g.196182  ORF Transcript_66831/g.196182 Transcript_66831/m.196182 type:complete len:205 (+) Transcript_66831:1407-2021(+)
MTSCPFASCAFSWSEADSSWRISFCRSCRMSLTRCRCSLDTFSSFVRFARSASSCAIPWSSCSLTASTCARVTFVTYWLPSSCAFSSFTVLSSGLTCRLPEAARLVRSWIFSTCFSRSLSRRRLALTFISRSFFSSACFCFSCFSASLMIWAWPSSSCLVALMSSFSLPTSSTFLFSSPSSSCLWAGSAAPGPVVSEVSSRTSS